MSKSRHSRNLTSLEQIATYIRQELFDNYDSKVILQFLQATFIQVPTAALTLTTTLQAYTNMTLPTNVNTTHPKSQIFVTGKLKKGGGRHRKGTSNHTLYHQTSLSYKKCATQRVVLRLRHTFGNNRLSISFIKFLHLGACHVRFLKLKKVFVVQQIF